MQEKIWLFLFSCNLIFYTEAIRCYQCDSKEDGSCPAYRFFDTRLNALVDCNSVQSHNPGVFCLKIYRESTGWNRWIKITRQCATRTSGGIAWGCVYTFEDRGMYKEVCYCQDRDGCNSAIGIKGMSLIGGVMSIVFSVIFKVFI